ncbi:hypothetical protein [Streptomyces erythrochromogenes]|uniref:hypothetical protein n=1 Tax=Streptomyces erythrochromogenes TaxID=285574 RepID=UPI003808DF65
MIDVRRAMRGALGELVLDGCLLDPALARAGTHVRDAHLGASVCESLRVVPDVAFPPVDCSDVAEWVVAQYNARNSTQPR